MIDPDKLYSLDEASPYVGMQRSAIYRAIREGRLRAIKTGRTTKLLGCDIILFRESLPVMPSRVAPTTPFPPPRAKAAGPQCPKKIHSLSS